MTSEAKNTIFDPLRRKQVAATPEEQVRQSVIRWLLDDQKIPISRMASEWSFKYNGLLYRADIVAFARDLSPALLVECKAPDVPITREVIYQWLRYNRVLNVRYMMWTNSKDIFICERIGEGPEYRFLETLPNFAI